MTMQSDILSVSVREITKIGDDTDINHGYLSLNLNLIKVNNRLHLQSLVQEEFLE